MAETQGKTATRIQPTQNGPYVIHSLENLSNSKGETLETKQVTALCRCGRSGNKPFCDGTHSKVGFDSSRTTDGRLNIRDDYSAGPLTVHDNRGVCAHIGRCTDGLPAVFRLETEPWIDPAGASEKTIVAQVHQCPSGALSHSHDGKEHRDLDRDPAVFVSKDGPYFVSGGIELEGEEWGEGASREHYTLCRCGGSSNKPFCDGTHWKDFKDDKN
jgi:CDGSH-type Zn-finger protein